MSEAAPHVTLVAHEVGTPGGMEGQLGRLVEGLLERDHEVTVVARACELGEHPALRWVRIPGPPRPFCLWYGWFFVAGSLAVWRRRGGLVHTTGAVILNRADVSTVHFCHRGFGRSVRMTRASRASLPYRANDWLAGVLSRLAESYCYRPSVSARLVAVSGGLARELRELFPAMSRVVEVIPNAVDSSAFSRDEVERAKRRAEWGSAEDELVALFVGGDWERKGLAYAIEAIARASRWTLVVVGEGDVERYSALARRRGAGRRVRFEGGTRHAAEYYSAADAFVLPTAYETFSLVTFEAAAAGLPLLVSRVSGVEDILVDGRNGWFIYRDVEVIAQRLDELGGNARLRAEMGEAARADSARFHWARSIEAYCDLYARLEAR